MCATTLLKERNRRQKMTETDVYMDRPTCSHHNRTWLLGIALSDVGIRAPYHIQNMGFDCCRLLIIFQRS